METLPSELIESICNDSNRLELMALRLVGRRVSSLATRSFSKRYIATVSSSMTRPSLNRLVAICEHPLFGPRIQKIHIVAGRINPEFVEYLTYTTKDRIEDRELALEQHADAKVVLQCAFNRSMKEPRMETSGKATELLSRAFAAVKIYNTPVTLQVTSNPWAGWEPVRHLDWHRDDTSGFNLKPALEFTIQPYLDAMANSKMHFTGLDLLVNDDMDTLDELVVDRSFISSVVGAEKVQATFQTMIERALLDPKVAYYEIMGS